MELVNYETLMSVTLCKHSKSLFRDIEDVHVHAQNKTNSTDHITSAYLHSTRQNQKCLVPVYCVLYCFNYSNKSSTFFCL